MNALLSLAIFFTSSAFGAEICSRVARINYQEVIVDSGDGKKGEGLRFYLDKDPISKELLDEYQEKNRPTALNAAISSLGSVLILSALFRTGESSQAKQRDTTLFAGLSIIGVNYLVNKTQARESEKILENAINQYNKRNYPKIYFNPYIDNDNNLGVGLGVTQDF